MDVQTNIFRWVEARSTGVDAHPDADRPLVEAGQRLLNGGDGFPCDREGVEKSVPLVVDLVPVVAANASRTTRRCSASAWV